MKLHSRRSSPPKSAQTMNGCESCARRNAALHNVGESEKSNIIDPPRRAVGFLEGTVFGRRGRCPDRKQEVPNEGLKGVHRDATSSESLHRVHAKRGSRHHPEAGGAD